MIVMLLMFGSLLFRAPLRGPFMGSTQMRSPALFRTHTAERDLAFQSPASARRTLCAGGGSAMEVFEMLVAVEALIFKDWHRLTSWHNGITSEAAYLRTF